MAARRVPLLLLGAALGALFLFLAFRSLDWREFGAALADARLADIALLLACLFAFFAIKSLRWTFVIAPFARARARVATHLDRSATWSVTRSREVCTTTNRPAL